MRRLSALFALIGLLLPATVHAQVKADAPPRETALDRKVHIEPGLALDVPKVPPLCDALPELSKQRIHAGDVELYCEQEGKGVPLVLLHGGPGATHHDFHPAFSRARGFARVLYYDQRGCGQSERKPDKRYSVAQAADDLHNLRIALGVEKWIVLGHSYGGALAQCYTVKYPREALELVLVCAQPAAPLNLRPTRQYDFLSPEERKKIREVHSNRGLTLPQRLFNAFLNGDWKRQSYYKPTADDLARIALYEWNPDPIFNGVMSFDLRKCDLRGAFDACPIPTLIVESQWDLTWNTDKPGRMQEMFPRAKLTLFEVSAHSPFADEPEKFFQVLQGFVEKQEGASPQALSAWEQCLADWRKRMEASFEYVVRSAGWGRESSRRIANAYSKESLGKLGDPTQFLRAGFALYDVGRYEDALVVFQEAPLRYPKDKWAAAVFGLWQASMLDLLNRREEAIALYKKVAEPNVGGNLSHDQYGLTYAPSPLAAERIKAPFKRVENKLED